MNFSEHLTWAASHSGSSCSIVSEKKRCCYGNVLRRCEYVTGNGRYVGLTATHMGGLRFVRPSGHVRSCIARRPAFSH
eukprot:2043953-Prymnesium_polylepis.1